MNKNHKKRVIIELSIIMFSLILLTLSFLEDYRDVFNLSDAAWFLVKIEDLDDLFINLFTVQATIAGLSFAIIAFISGVTDKIVYGISVSEYISRKKPCVLKHKTLLVFDLILTIVDYFAVSLQWFNLSVAIFIISIIISILLIIDVFFIFYGETEIKNKICEYILDTYDNKYISETSEKIKTVIKKKDIDNINDFFDILSKIFEKEIATNKNAETLETIQNLYTQSFIDTVKLEDNKLSIHILDNIIKVYESSTKDEDIVPLTIWDQIEQSYFILLRNLSLFEIQENKHRIITEFRKILYKNSSINQKGKLINHFNLEYFSHNSYSNIVSHKGLKLSNYESESITEYLFGLSFYDIAYNNKQFEEYQNEILFNELINIIKLLIEDGQSEVLDNCFITKIHYYKNSYIELAFVISCVYMYYLGYREEIVKNKPKQKNSIELINTIITRLRRIIKNIDYITIAKTKRKYIISKMRRWESFNRNVGKAVIMDDTMYDFIFFSLIMFYNNQIAMDVVQTLSHDEFLSIVNRYINKYELTHQLFNEFSSFNNINLNNTDRFKDFVSGLKVYVKKYEQTQLRISNDIDLKKSENAYLTHLEKSLNNSIHEVLEELKFKKPEKKDTNYDLFPKRFFILTVPVSTVTEIYNDQNDEYKDIFKQFFQDNIDYLLKEQLVTKKISWEETDNHKLLLQMEKDKNITPDVFYGDKSILWDLDESEFYKTFGQLRYINSNGTLVALIDSKKVQIDIFDVNLRFENLSLKDITYEKNDEIYKYTNSYGLTLEYEEEELLEYINAIRKKVRISVRIAFKIDENSGVALDIALN